MTEARRSGLAPRRSRFPLRLGSTGSAIVDLHNRLDGAGFPPGADDTDEYGVDSEVAVSAFQTARGLPITGVCDIETWELIVEAGWTLGDRLLYLQSPMMRGDDVEELQSSLCSLGFDAGRADGIFGPDTHHALVDFQRNSALVPDGISGHTTVAAMSRLGGRTTTGRFVSAVREQAMLAVPLPADRARRVSLGSFGTADPLCDSVARRLRRRGHRVHAIVHPEASQHAQEANLFAADLYLGFEIAQTGDNSLAYFASTRGFVSIGARSLAEALTEVVTTTLRGVAYSLGMQRPVLRETNMPAVLCGLAPARDVVRHQAELGESIAGAIEAWRTAESCDG